MRHDPRINHPEGKDFYGVPEELPPVDIKHLYVLRDVRRQVRLRSECSHSIAHGCIQTILVESFAKAFRMAPNQLTDA